MNHEIILLIDKTVNIKKIEGLRALQYNKVCVIIHTDSFIFPLTFLFEYYECSGNRFKGKYNRTLME